MKWVYKLKKDARGKIIKYKARLVTKWYIQQQRIDFDKVFSPDARLDIVRLLVAIVAYEG